MGVLRRAAQGAAAILAAVAYVWYAAVRGLPEVKRRKAARRAARRRAPAG